MKRIFASALLAATLISPAWAAGLSVEETQQQLEQQGEQLLFIDVRDPVEIMFIGSTPATHINIPYMLVDRHQWDAENNRFRMYVNPDFATEVDAALKARGLSRDSQIITLCRSGSERGEPSARYLQEQGFSNVNYVINGFQGSVVQEGEHAGKRLINGWQNSGLPWTPRMDADKIYRPQH